jgi:ATP adenylyltransferase
MEHIYAPWRETFIKGEKQQECIFCPPALAQNDLLIYEGKTAAVMMNRYPYCGGHLLIFPKRHLDRLSLLSVKEKLEIMDMTSKALEILSELQNPEGFNIGVNLGRPAGAGVLGHLHWHLVPRWGGDTNFMTVAGETRVLSEDLFQLRDRLRQSFLAFSPIQPGGTAKRRPSRRKLQEVGE